MEDNILLCSLESDSAVGATLCPMWRSGQKRERSRLFVAWAMEDLQKAPQLSNYKKGKP